MVRDSCRVVNLVEAHHVRDDLLVDVRFAITFNQIGQDLDGSTGLVAENLASGDVVCGDNVRRFVLLHFSKLCTSFLELTIENVHEGCIEADHHLDAHRCLINVILLWQGAQNSIQEVIHLALSCVLRVSASLVKQQANTIEEFLGLCSSTRLQAEPASFAQDEGRLGKEFGALNDDFVSVAIVHQSGVHSADLMGKHDVLGCTVIFRRECTE